MADETQIREAREAKARFSEQLLRNPDVHGVGVGYRRREGRLTDEIAIVVHVERKRPEADVPARQLLPRSVRYRNRQNEEVEIAIDVVEKPLPIPELDCADCAADLTDRVRPVPGGYSGGPSTSTGTLGGWVWDNVTDQIAVISNDHVFGGTAGTAITQPGPFDGGSSPADRIADVLRSGSLDVSIAAPSTPDIYELEIECGGPGVYEIADAELGMVVQKTGRTTGLTCGIVELIDYDSNRYGSHNDLWIDGDGNDFSMGGDSGSLYLERDHPDGEEWRRVVGLHWGGAGDDGVGHPIGAVFEDLDLSTVCTGVVSQVIEALFGRREEGLLREAEEKVVALPKPSAQDGRSFFWKDISALIIGRILGWPRRRPTRRTFAREVESRIAAMRRGAEVVELLHRNRVLAVRVLLNPDGRRAVAAALAPLAEQTITTDDLLSYVVTQDDVANVHRLLTVAERLGGDSVAEAVGYGRELIAEGARRSVRDLLS